LGENARKRFGGRAEQSPSTMGRGMTVLQSRRVRRERQRVELLGSVADFMIA
jgi:hypothetical protein